MASPTLDTATFRQQFPEFECTQTYPKAQIDFWLDVAGRFVDGSRWANSTNLGVALYTAHQIVIEAKSMKEASVGGIPGQQTGPISSKSVDKVSIGYDTGAVTEKDAGHWNQTIYGTRFYRLAKIFGAGPLQVGIGYTPPLNGPAWSGPLTTPGFTNFGS